MVGGLRYCSKVDRPGALALLAKESSESPRPCVGSEGQSRLNAHVAVKPATAQDVRSPKSPRWHPLARGWSVALHMAASRGSEDPKGHDTPTDGGLRPTAGETSRPPAAGRGVLR